MSTDFTAAPSKQSTPFRTFGSASPSSISASSASPSLHPTAERLLREIRKRAVDGQCEVKFEDLAKASAMGVSTAYKYSTVLQDEGLITVLKRPNHAPLILLQGEMALSLDGMGLSAEKADESPDRDGESPSSTSESAGPTRDFAPPTTTPRGSEKPSESSPIEEDLVALGVGAVQEPPQDPGTTTASSRGTLAGSGTLTDMAAAVEAMPLERLMAICRGHWSDIARAAAATYDEFGAVPAGQLAKARKVIAENGLGAPPVPPAPSRAARPDRFDPQPWLEGADAADFSGFIDNGAEIKPGYGASTVPDLPVEGYALRSVAPAEFVYAPYPLDWDVCNWVCSARNWLWDIAELDDGRPSLLLTGPVGTGKSTLAWGAARMVLQLMAFEGRRLGKTSYASVFGGQVAALFHAARAEFDKPKKRPWSALDMEHFDEWDDKGTLERMVEADVLVLDDLGAEKVSEWVAQELDRIIDARWTAALPTIVTTNLTIPELLDRVGDRVVSRLVGGGWVVAVVGHDLRDAEHMSTRADRYADAVAKAEAEPD